MSHHEECSIYFGGRTCDCGEAFQNPPPAAAGPEPMPEDVLDVTHIVAQGRDHGLYVRMSDLRALLGTQGYEIVKKGGAT